MSGSLKVTYILPLSVVLTLSLVGCKESNRAVTGGNSQVRVLLTDAPSDALASANVTISRVYLVGGGGSPVDVMPATDAPAAFDLLDLRNGTEALLADHPVPAGSYGQLRLVVASAEVTLADGTTFEDGTTTRTLKVPSGEESGIKVQLAAPIEADPEQVTIVVVDFDVDRNFVFQGGHGTTVKDVLFTPVLQEKRRQESVVP